MNIDKRGICAVWKCYWARNLMEAGTDGIQAICVICDRIVECEKEEASGRNYYLLHQVPNLAAKGCQINNSAHETRCY